MWIQRPVQAQIEVFNVDSDGDKNYLSVGEQPLPAIYLSFGCVYVALSALWIARVRKRKESVCAAVLSLAATSMTLIPAFPGSQDSSHDEYCGGCQGAVPSC